METEVKTKNFGRLSAQTAKQVIIQGIREAERTNIMKEYEKKREAAKAEYKALVDSGKVRPPTEMEKRLKIAQGRSENAAVQAARRVLTRRGIDWRTGKAL